MQSHVYAAMKQVDDVIDLKVSEEGEREGGREGGWSIV